MLRQSDLLSGLVFIVLGVAFGLGALGYRIGTPARMGSGFLPLSLAVILTVLGIAILVKAWAKRGEEVEWGKAWPFVAVLGSIVLFAVTLRPLGFVAACFITVITAGFAGPPVTPLQRLVPAMVLSALATVVFVKLLGLPLPLWPAFVG